MAQHTPGPWTLHTTGSDGHGWVVQHPVDGAYRGVAQVRGSSRQAQANARLIAAAPDLLAAAEEVMDRWDRNSGHPVREPGGLEAGATLRTP